MAQKPIDKSIISWSRPLKESCQQSFIAAAVFSGIANLLMLVPAFFMLNVYDKAIGANSLSTLAVLSFITVCMFLGLTVMEVVRSRMLVAIGRKIDKLVGPLVYEATFQNALRAGSTGANTQPLTDFSALRQFVSGPGTITLFDTPWMPIYLVVMFMFHPMLGWLGVGAGLLMLTLAIMNQKVTAERLQNANVLARENLNFTAGAIANVEAAAVMGMLPAMKKTWESGQDAVLEEQETASNWGGLFAAVTKTFRLAIQSAAIAVGALLVLQQEISPGMLIAGSILIGRALQPIELAVGSWKGFIDAKGQYQRLQILFEATDWTADRMSLPRLRGGVTANEATIVPPGTQTPALRDATFNIMPGTTCVVIGPSGAGKSTLIRGILGLWRTCSGYIRIDGAESSHYSRAELGPQIGYLPQAIELFDGSVSANIARQGELDADHVLTAANDAGIHDFILSLPDAYDTELGRKSGVILSPGQKQRIALARALYKRPTLVVLDEPNSNLDKAGEMALNRAIATLKDAGSTIIIVSHREGALSLADQLIVVSSGSVVDSGPSAEVLTRLRQQMAVSQAESQASKAPPKGSVKTVPVSFLPLSTDN
ncbi:type I secretion system permease/ATPase [Luminiphilus sp.]|nr:type I secretion system permease/ATPase [Luminiphilus sp.]